MSVTLVTGGAGFVGAHLVAALRARGETVRVLDLSVADTSDPQHSIQGSVTDAVAVARAMEDVSSVFHLAGNAQLWARDPSIFEAANVTGAKITAEAARAAGVERFVYCSSLTTLVGRKTPIGPSRADEEVRLAPDDMLGAYPRSKLLGEEAVMQAIADGLDAVIAVPTEPIGPGDENLTPPTQMMLDFLNGDTPAYIDCVLNFVPVESLAEGLIAARERGATGERYVLGGENTPLADLLAMMAEMTGRKMPRLKMPYWVALAAGAVDTGLSNISGQPPKAPLTGVRLAGRRVSFSSARAKEKLGWEATPVRDALARTIDWFEKRNLLKPAR